MSSDIPAAMARDQTSQPEAPQTRRERRAAERASSGTSESTSEQTDTTSKTWSELREAVLSAEEAFLAAESALDDARRSERRAESEALQARLAQGARSTLGATPRLVRAVLSLGSNSRLPDHHAGDPGPSAEYQAAELLVHLAMAVSASDGRIVDVETSTLMAHIESALGLNEDERTRLTAHARWCASAAINVAGLSTRMDQLTSDQRSSLAELLLRVAASDRILAPEEDVILTEIFRFLGENPATVAQRVTAHIDLDGVDQGRRADNDQPSVVWRAPAPAPGQAIPRPPVPNPVPGPVPLQSQPSSSPSAFVLDHRVIESTLRSTSLVSALLRDIFTDEFEPEHAEGPRDSSAPFYAGLDAAHSRLLAQLAAHSELPRIDFDALARALDILPDGAIDTLNEAALDTADEPLIEGDDPLVVSLDVLQEMMT